MRCLCREVTGYNFFKKDPLADLLDMGGKVERMNRIGDMS